MMNYFTIINFFWLFLFISPQEEVIIDSSLSFEEAVSGIKIPDKVLKTLTLLDVEYYSFDNKVHRGQLVIHKDLAGEIAEIFRFIKKEKFPVEKVIPISKYNWNDDSSMADNNSSAFNYRRVKGSTRLSAHSMGRAIDINPLLNPHIKRGIPHPSGGVYNKLNPGTLTAEGKIVKEFRKRGWQWGGLWRSSKDYQHFEK
jgi:peptidoglycan LD-endopeptidase CwlK